MKLTKKKAVDISIELWEWLDETGSEFKFDWPGWEKYGYMWADCALCQYDTQYDRDCDHCPYHKRFGDCMNGVYGNWTDAKTKTQRIKYAKLFLEELLELK